MKRSTAKFRIEDLLTMDGLLDYSYGGHNALPSSYEEIAETILKEIDTWNVWEPECDLCSDTGEIGLGYGSEECECKK